MLYNELTREGLYSHIEYIIVDTNRPFAIIKRSSFINLLGACNENILQMTVKADANQNHRFRMYLSTAYSSRSNISKVEWIAFTSDSCTSSNVKSLMALTAHNIDTEEKMQELLRRVPAVMGECIFLIAWVL